MAGPWSHLNILGSQILFPTLSVLGPTWIIWSPGRGSHLRGLHSRVPVLGPGLTFWHVEENVLNIQTNLLICMIHLFKLNKGSGEEAVENTKVGNGFLCLHDCTTIVQTSSERLSEHFNLLAAFSLEECFVFYLYL